MLSSRVSRIPLLAAVLCFFCRDQAVRFSFQIARRSAAAGHSQKQLTGSRAAPSADQERLAHLEPGELHNAWLLPPIFRF